MSAILTLAMLDLCDSADPGTAYFKAHNIDVAAISPATGGTFVSRIHVVPPRFFEPDQAGKPAAWCEARDEFGNVVDVVAWSVRNPSKIVTLLGRAAVLGAEAAHDPVTYLDGSPLRVFRTPLAWLQARCMGVAILDMAKAARFLIDVPASQIAAEDDAHAREIMDARRVLVAGQSIVVPRRDLEHLCEAA